MSTGRSGGNWCKVKDTEDNVCMSCYCIKFSLSDASILKIMSYNNNINKITINRMTHIKYLFGNNMYHTYPFFFISCVSRIMIGVKVRK